MGLGISWGGRAHILILDQVVIIIIMSQKERLLDLNRQTDDQTNRLRMMNRVVNESNDTTNNIMRELGDQREKINNNIDMSDNIKLNLKSADKKTKEMNRRNLCIKCSLYLVIIVLFVCIVVSLIYKLTK